MDFKRKHLDNMLAINHKQQVVDHRQQAINHMQATIH
jgi:hypothetical protein